MSEAVEQDWHIFDDDELRALWQEARAHEDREFVTQCEQEMRRRKEAKHGPNS